MKDYKGFNKKSMNFKGTLKQIVQQQALINESDNMITEASQIFPLNQLSESTAILDKDGKVTGSTEIEPLYECIIYYKVKESEQKQELRVRI